MVNLPPVSTTLVKLVAKFAAGVVDTGGKFAAGVVDTGGAPWIANISTIFRKNLNRSYWDNLGLGGNWFMKKTRSRKSRDTVPLKGHGKEKYLWFFLNGFPITTYYVAAFRIYLSVLRVVDKILFASLFIAGGVAVFMIWGIDLSRFLNAIISINRLQNLEKSVYISRESPMQLKKI